MAGEDTTLPLNVIASDATLAVEAGTHADQSLYHYHSGYDTDHSLSF